jgi:hypothetical protein
VRVLRDSQGSLRAFTDALARTASRSALIRAKAPGGCMDGRNSLLEGQRPPAGTCPSAAVVVPGGHEIQ